MYCVGSLPVAIFHHTPKLSLLLALVPTLTGVQPAGGLNVGAESPSVASAAIKRSPAAVPPGFGMLMLVVPLVWPCDNDLGIVKDYWDDQKSADSSAWSFARVLEKFIAWRNSEKYNPQADPCLKRINVLSHSMGNRVLRETLAAWNRYDLANGVPLIFRNTFMVAADIVNESLHVGERGELICHASRNVIVYHASDDLALRASKASNLKNRIASRRLGHTGPEDINLTPSNVYSVDCDDVNNAYDLKGHTYFRYGRKKGQPGIVFEHIFDTLVSGRVFPDDEYRRSTILSER